MRIRILPAALVLVVAGALVLLFVHHSPSTPSTTSSPATSTTISSGPTTTHRTAPPTTDPSSPAAVQARDEASFAPACNAALSAARVIIMDMRAGVVPTAAKNAQMTASISNAFLKCSPSNYNTFIANEYNSLPSTAPSH